MLYRDDVQSCVYLFVFCFLSFFGLSRVGSGKGTDRRAVGKSTVQRGKGKEKGRKPNRQRGEVNIDCDYT